jgi:hypothetical protein
VYFGFSGAWFDRSATSVQEVVMSEKVKILLFALWIAHPILLTAIAVVMLRRGQHRVYKYFFAYVVTQVPISLLCLTTYWCNLPANFYVYSVTIAISVVFGFMVIYEVFRDVFRQFHALRDLGVVVFRWALLLMLLVAAVIAVSTRSSDLTPLEEAIGVAHRCVRIVQVGMVFFMLIFAGYLGVNWRERSFGIALGFGTFSFVELALLASFAGYRLGQIPMGIVNMAAYNAALLIWLRYALARSPARQDSGTTPQSQRWEQVLRGVRYPPDVDSLIPTFEGMVDRALLRAETPPAPAVYRELNLLETELNENVKALKFTSRQILRRLARLGVLNRNQQSRGGNSRDR